MDRRNLWRVDAGAELTLIIDDTDVDLTSLILFINTKNTQFQVVNRVVTGPRRERVLIVTTLGVIWLRVSWSSSFVELDHLQLFVTYS